MFAFREKVTEGEGTRLSDDGRGKPRLSEEWAVENDV